MRSQQTFIRASTQSGVAQCVGGRAKFAAYPDVIARTRTIAPQAALQINVADHGDADAKRTAGRVATDEFAGMLGSECKQTLAERIQPGVVVVVAERKRKREGPGTGTHRRKIGEVDRERLVPERCRVDVRPEVPSSHEHVGGDRAKRIPPGL